MDTVFMRVFFRLGDSIVQNVFKILHRRHESSGLTWNQEIGRDKMWADQEVMIYNVLDSV